MLGAFRSLFECDPCGVKDPDADGDQQKWDSRSMTQITISRRSAFNVRLPGRPQFQLRM